MRFMMLLKASPDSEAGVMPSPDLIEEMGRYNEQLIQSGALVDAAGLQASSKGARVRFSGSRRTVMDGPFTETKELLAGYWIIQAKSLAEAIDWAKRCPRPHIGEEAEIEIRPMFETEDFPDAPKWVVEQELKQRNAQASPAKSKQGKRK